jgi:predicted PhzF superfamily epimerase YddE/YHI9
MGRPSRIEVEIDGADVTIAGPCVPVMAGVLTL